MKKDTGGKLNPFSAFILHLHPRTVPLETIRFTLSFGLGGMAATLVLVMVCTGLLQLIQYTPNPEGAYSSIQLMYSPGVFSGFVRNIHYWAGNALVIVAALHVCILPALLMLFLICHFWLIERLADWFMTKVTTA